MEKKSRGASVGLVVSQSLNGGGGGECEENSSICLSDVVFDCSKYDNILEKSMKLYLMIWQLRARKCIITPARVTCYNIANRPISYHLTCA